MFAMELNLTLPHLYIVLMMSVIGARFLRGDKLVRYIGWVSLWQLLSPVRPWNEDIPLMLIAFFFSEFIYLQLVVTVKCLYGTATHSVTTIVL